MVVLITGITSGFGRAMAGRLSEEGHVVYGTCRRDCEKLPGVVYLKVDVSDENQIAAAVTEVVQTQGKIDVFINNAGIGIGGPIEFSPIEDVRHQMDVNWTGFVRCLHYVLPVMRKQGSGRIICFSSIGGVMGLPYQGIYSASKFAIEGTAEALRLELKGTGIDVVVVEPGDFCTGFTSARKCVESDEASQAYPMYRHYLQSYVGDENSGLKPEYLARKISSIVKSKRPRYRYVIAMPVQKLSVYLKRFLPDRLYAAIFSAHYR